MSRFALICSLVFGLSSTALVTTADAQFAKAPPAAAAVTAGGVTAAASGVDNQLRVAPRRALDRAAVRRALAKARSTNLAAFRAYQAKGVFPSNTFDSTRLNVWIDAAGNLCAAATIIKRSGQGDLVARIGAQDNFIRLGDVTHGPVMDWILTSGFTQDEIAAIQEPFMPVMNEPEPAVPVLAIDTTKRKAEDRRLRAKYTVVTQQIAKNGRTSLDKAVDRLMKNHELARRLLDAQS